MTALSTPANRAAARPMIPRSALVVIAMLAIVAVLAVVAVNALVVASVSPAGYDAPFYSSYLQEIGQGW